VSVRGRLVHGATLGATLGVALAFAGACASTGAHPTDRSVVGGHPLANYPPADLDRRHPLTRPERTNFSETSTHADVVAFLDSLKQSSPDVWVGSLGRTSLGRDIPMVVLSRPLVHTPAEAKRLNRPIVYLQGDIHGGEVEGKEALLSLLRDLARDPFKNVVDSLVIVAVPIYNADGNDSLAPQEQNRYEQNGPAIIGRRANGQGLDLNRDYIKAEAPETRAALDFFRAWEPDVFVDLHTTDGSLHGYNLTYSPPLNPAARFSGPYTQDTVLPGLRVAVEKFEGVKTFPYGNFVAQDSMERGWFTYDHRPRFGTNYYGLRGRVAILSEAYSHDPLRRRIASTYAFVSELLSTISDNASDFMEVGAEADRKTTSFGTSPATAPPVAIRSQMTTHPKMQDVLVEDLVATGDSTRTEPGLPRGIRRTGHFHTVHIPVYDRFEPTLTRALPYAWIVPADAPGVIELLRRHGVIIEQAPQGGVAAGERFAIDSVVHAAQPFQGHHETRVVGRWNGVDSLRVPAGSYVVRAGQPLAILAQYLLDPESDDGLVTWNFLDAWLSPGATYPISRVDAPLSFPLTPTR
jgi:Zinc carboxypeptidase